MSVFKSEADKSLDKSLDGLESDLNLSVDWFVEVDLFI